MADKPSYEELEERIKKLEKGISEKEKIEQALRNSEQRERTLRRVTPNIHYLISPEGVVDGKILEINHSVDILGYTPEELIGKPLSAIIHPEEIEKISRAFVLPPLIGMNIEKQGRKQPKLGDERRKGKRRTLDLETILVAKDGRIVPVIINATGLYEGDNAESKFLGTYGIITDISELKQMTEELMKKEVFNYALFEFNPIETIVVDNEGRIVSYNKAKRESGRRLPNIGDVMYKDYAAKHKIDMYDELMKCIDSGQSKTFADVNYTDEILSIAIVPFPEGAIITLIDNTEERRLEEQLRIRQGIDAIGALAEGFAHDYNNLLAAINGGFQLISIESERLSDVQKRHVDDGLAACKKAVALTSQISNISKSEKDFYRKKDVELYETASKVFDLLGETTDRIIEKRNELEEGKYFVRADSGLQQILTNLGTNAVWAIEQRGAKEGDYVRIRAEEYKVKGKDTTGLPDGDYVHIFFEDNGIGMTEEVRKRAFEYLFTTKKRSSQKGQGLGLTTVYNTVTKHYEGHISIETEEGKGTTYHIYLPKAKEKKREKDMTEIIKGNETILSIDDDENCAKVVDALLTSLGYKVIKASDGKEGLDSYFANKDSIDLVLLDLTMPKMSGADVLQEILIINPEAKVVISSGHRQKENDQGILSKAKAYMNKPYDRNELSHTIRKVLDL